MGFHYRFKPDDFSLKPSENSNVQIKSKTIYISPTTKPSVETNMFQVNFRANPQPKTSGCQWMKKVAVNQSSVPCLILSNGNEDGEYFVNFNQTQVLTQESSIVISITNDIGMSNFTFDIVLPELYLEINKQRAKDSIEIDLEKTKETSDKETSIDCVAVGVYSKPEFKWFLANESLNTTNAVIEQLDENISTLTYEGSSEDLGKILKCEIHQIHTNTELQIDIIEATAELDIQ